MGWIDQVEIVGTVFRVLKIQNTLSDCDTHARWHVLARKSRGLPRPDRKIHRIHEDDPRCAADRSCTERLTQFAPGLAVIVMPVHAGRELDVLAATARNQASAPALIIDVIQRVVDFGVEKTATSGIVDR